MTRSAEVTSRREDRASSRRNQILNAARGCVIAEGFHGASISRICAAASITVGHLYKIFESKEAIMVALTERDFEEFMLHITHPDNLEGLNIDGLIDRYLNDVQWLLDFDRAALAQEVLAEAARNPKVAELVARVDSQFRDAIRKIVESALDGLSEGEINGRIETLLVMTRALSLHASTHPASDPGIIAPGFEIALRAVLSPPSQPIDATHADLRTGQVQRMEDLERENQQLRRIISDLTLEKLILQESARENS